jgi:hypothetical protein
MAKEVYCPERRTRDNLTDYSGIYLANKYINQPKASEATVITKKRVSPYFSLDLKSDLLIRARTIETRRA